MSPRTANDLAREILDDCIVIARKHRSKARGHTAKATSWIPMNKLRFMRRRVHALQEVVALSWIRVAHDLTLSVACNATPNEAATIDAYSEVKWVLDYLLDLSDYQEIKMRLFNANGNPGD